MHNLLQQIYFMLWRSVSIFSLRVVTFKANHRNACVAFHVPRFQFCSLNKIFIPFPQFSDWHELFFLNPFMHTHYSLFEKNNVWTQGSSNHTDTDMRTMFGYFPKAVWTSCWTKSSSPFWLAAIIVIDYSASLSFFWGNSRGGNSY